MQKSPIQWTDFTANVIRARLKAGHNPAGGLGSGVGHWCQKISPGCANCYSSEMQRRFGTPAFDARNADLVEPFLDVEEMEAIKRRKKPALIFLSNMTDLFGDWVPDDWLNAIWDMMDACPQHTFQLLTKRPERMADYTIRRSHDHFNLQNVWCGVSVENQETANQRRGPFQDVQADVKFVSYEPALGPVDFAGWKFVQQIISGGESGRNARPSHPGWHRSTRDFCKRNGIAYFFKQWGRWGPYESDPGRCNTTRIDCQGREVNGLPGLFDQSDAVMVQKYAVPLLDGREWNEMPTKTIQT